MFAQFQAIIAAIRAIIDLWKYFQNWKIQQEKVEAEKRQQDLENAVDKVAEGQTDEEIFNEQDKVVSNRPRP
jgi:hypothetical protein